MKMVEIKLRSITAEMEKLIAKKERAEKKLAKATEKVEKLGCKWSRDEHSAWMDTVETNNGWLTNKKEIEINGAWMDWYGAERDLQEINDRIERMNTKCEKAQAQVDEYHVQIAKITDAKERENLKRLTFEDEKKEWAKDGIELIGRYWGNTPNGKRFYIERNHGWTQRSLYCYTLTIDGYTIFTSGEFWRCYMEIKKR